MFVYSKLIVTTCHLRYRHLLVKSSFVRTEIIHTTWSTCQSFEFAIDQIVPVLLTKLIVVALGLTSLTFLH